MHVITSVKDKIICLDLQKQHRKIKAEIFRSLEKVYDHTAFSDGFYVNGFENKFATFCQAKYAIAVNNGTSALHLAMLTLGIGPGDEVIVPANTFIATAWAVSYTGAIPVFADCTADTWQINPVSIQKNITSRTKLVVGVHLYGQPCNIDEIKRICESAQIMFLEDSAQAHGALYKDISVGTFGEMACFSFYPGKNLGACGEAGAIVTNTEAYNVRLRSLRNHGSQARYYHNELGFNMRMSGFEAASLQVKLKYLNSWNARRREIACMYQSGIKNIKISLQFQPLWATSVYHLFVITTNHRDELIEYLNEHNIYPGLHYPVPCHLQKAYAFLNYKEGDCPNAEYLASHCLSLPMYAELEDEQVIYIINVLNQY